MDRIESEQDSFASMDPTGLATRILNALNRFSTDLREANRKLDENRTRLKQIQAKLGLPFPDANELNEAIAEAARLAAEMAADGSAVPSNTTLATIREAGAWDLFVGAGKGARRAAPRRAPADDVVMFRSGTAEESPESAGASFSRGNQELRGAVKVPPVGLSGAEAVAITARVLRSFPAHRRASIKPMGTFAELPPEVQEQYQREHGESRTDAKAVHGSDVIYLVAANHHSTADHEASILHELVGHAGIRALRTSARWRT
jgi:hypothetical protein